MIDYSRILKYLGRKFDIVGIAASAGGLKAISEIISGLPPDFKAPVVVVQHLSPDHKSYLAPILSMHTALSVKEAEDGEKLARGTIYVGKPDRHVIVNSNGTISLTLMKKVHFVRPSADILFESIAYNFGEKAIAVVLTGAGVDGAIGALAVKTAKGVVIVQEDPEFPGMPEATIEADHVDLIMPLTEIAPTLVALIEGRMEV